MTVRSVPLIDFSKPQNEYISFKIQRRVLVTMFFTYFFLFDLIKTFDLNVHITRFATL